MYLFTEHLLLSRLVGTAYFLKLWPGPHPEHWLFVRPRRSGKILWYFKL